MLDQLKPEPAAEPTAKPNNADLLRRLNEQINNMKDKVEFLDAEKKLIMNDKDMQGEFGNEGQSLDQNLKGLEAERTNMLKQEEDLKQKWTGKVKDIEGKNMELMAEKDKILGDFHDQKTREETNLQN